MSRVKRFRVFGLVIVVVFLILVSALDSTVTVVHSIEPTIGVKANFQLTKPGIQRTLIIRPTLPRVIVTIVRTPVIVITLRATNTPRVIKPPVTRVVTILPPRTLVPPRTLLPPRTFIPPPRTLIPVTLVTKPPKPTNTPTPRIIVTLRPPVTRPPLTLIPPRFTKTFTPTPAPRKWNIIAVCYFPPATPGSPFIARFAYTSSFTIPLPLTSSAFIPPLAGGSSPGVFLPGTHAFNVQVAGGVIVQSWAVSAAGQAKTVAIVVGQSPKCLQRPTLTPTNTPTITPSFTPTSTSTQTSTFTPSPTNTGTVTPVVVTATQVPPPTVIVVTVIPPTRIPVTPRPQTCRDDSLIFERLMPASNRSDIITRNMVTGAEVNETAALGGFARHPRWMGTDGCSFVFAFVRSGESNADIWMSNRGQFVQLTNTPDVNEADPDWVKGTVVVFVGRDGRLFTLDSANPATTLVPLPAIGSQPDVSPDGNRILFKNSENVLSEVSVVGGSVRELALEANNIRWDPSGLSFYFGIVDETGEKLARFDFASQSLTVLDDTSVDITVSPRGNGQSVLVSEPTGQEQLVMVLTLNPLGPKTPLTAASTDPANPVTNLSPDFYSTVRAPYNMSLAIEYFNSLEVSPSA